MRNTPTNSDDIIDSRDIIERIEELEGQQTPRYVAGWGAPGYMSYSESAEFDDADDAREYIASAMESYASEMDIYAEDLKSYAEDLDGVDLELINELINGLEEALKQLRDSTNDEYGQSIREWHWFITEDGTMGLDDDEKEELKTLLALQEECEGYSDWIHGATLIRETYFTQYAMDLAEDLGIPFDKNQSWPYSCIDWDQAAKELQQDYTTVTFDGEDYLIR